MVSEVKELDTYLTAYEKMAVMLAGLLHDLGHGPFSHAFETISKQKHEAYTVSIILDEQSEVHQALVNEHPQLPQEVAKIIQYLHEKNCLNQMISGQLDADRMDYLLRDAYFTGTNYGNFDLERILRTIRVHNGRIVVKESGMHSVEDYVMARYHMYWQVYLHPVARSYEKLLIGFFKRIKQLYQDDPTSLQEVTMFHPFLKDTPASNEDLYRLDESATSYGFSVLQNHQDKIIADLASRLLNRRLFVYEPLLDEQHYQEIEEKVKAFGYDPTYYVYRDTITQRPYAPYTGKEEKDAVWILKENGDVIALEEASEIVRALTKMEEREVQKVFYPDKAI